MIFSKRSYYGEVFLDHRASPGIPADMARKFGYAPEQVAEGKVFEAATLGCPHCGAHVVMNPLRTRERAHCFKCNAYICDYCDAARSDPDYVHHTIQEIRDLVSSGSYAVDGQTMHRPILTPTRGK